MSRTRKTVGILFSVIGVLLLFHPTLLPLVAYPLIHVDDPDNDATNLIFLRSAKISDDAFSFAKEFANRDPKHRVFVFHDFVRRAEAIGAAPSFLNITTQMLVDAGVPQEQIGVVGDGTAITSIEEIQQSDAWLAGQPSDARLMIVTGLLESGKYSTVAKQYIDPSLRDRVRILGFEVRGINSSNWWHTRTGLKDVLRNQLRLIHYWLTGERRPDVDWDPDAYEQQLVKAHAE